MKAGEEEKAGLEERGEEEEGRVAGHCKVEGEGRVKVAEEERMEEEG